jgi:hypothetical protein
VAENQNRMMLLKKRIKAKKEWDPHLDGQNQKRLSKPCDRVSTLPNPIYSVTCIGFGYAYPTIKLLVPDTCATGFYDRFQTLLMGC